MAIDTFELNLTRLDDPFEDGFAITASDATDLVKMTRAIHVGTAGDLRVMLKSGAIVTLTNVSVGIHRLRVHRVYATGTTATGLVGLL